MTLRLTLPSILLLIGLLGHYSPIFAQDLFQPEPTPYFQKKSEGWFWRKEDPVPKPPAKPKPEKKEVVVAPPAPTASAPVMQPFSVAWLRENLPKLLDRAIDEPTPENISAYMYAQRITMDKAQVYAENTQKVVLADPMLDEVGRTSFSTFGRLATSNAQSAAKERVIRRMTEVGGLWMFYDSSCAYCVSMGESLKNLTYRYGFNTKYISLDNKPLPNIEKWVKDEGQSKKLELRLTPTVVFVVPPNNYFVVSQGVMSMSDLVDRILVAAENQNLLTQDELRALYPAKNGILTAKDAADGATNDPVALVNNLRKKILGNSYGITAPTSSPVK